MIKRPYEVTVIGILFILIGLAASAYHLHKLGLPQAARGANIWIFAVELIIIITGVFILRGQNWARWLAVAWMAFHVAISFLNSMNQVAFHAALFAIFAYFLFRSESSPYFRRESRNASPAASA
jgi:hypothetical protein